MKKLCFFSSNFKSPFQDVVMQNEDVWLCDIEMAAFEYKVKSWKHFRGCFFRSKKNADILNSHESSILVMISHFSKNDIFGSTIFEITGRRTWKRNWKETFDCKLVYILGKTVQDMVLDSYLQQIASSQVTLFWCF